MAYLVMAYIIMARYDTELGSWIDVCDVPQTAEALCISKDGSTI